MTEGTTVQEFRPFKVGILPTMRYWEDDETGVIVKRGQIVEIVSGRQFRSSELRFALMRSRVLVKEGQCDFVFRGKIVRLTPGENKNIITVIAGEEEKVKEDEPAKVVDVKESTESVGESAAKIPIIEKLVDDKPVAQEKPKKDKRDLRKYEKSMMLEEKSLKA